VIVKICGITRAEDALAAVEFGADAIGFVFWPGSPRFIDPDRAREIAAALPPFITPVGVFVNQTPDHVNRIAALVTLGAVQLHGDERPEAAVAIARPVIKAIAVRDHFDPASLDEWSSRTTILLDVHDPVARGGTGRTIDWRTAAEAARRRRVVLAGGLTPENVCAAVTIARPFGIDVSSGVESRPGIKDHTRLKALFEAVHVYHDAARS
jgi:phosphoribosylanthranilate isomerase